MSPYRYAPTLELFEMIFFRHAVAGETTRRLSLGRGSSPGGRDFFFNSVSTYRYAPTLELFEMIFFQFRVDVPLRTDIGIV